MSFVIVTDTSANLPKEIILKYNITVVPLSYHINNQEETCLDLSLFDSKMFYDNIRKGAIVTTSQITPQRYIDSIDNILHEGNDVLFIGMSSGVSGSFNSAQIAIKDLKNRYPSRKIYLVDTLGASLGEGMVVLKAIECLEKSILIEETVNILHRFKFCIYQVFTVDNLMHLKRSGRISNTTALLGSMLNIKPILKGNEEGKIINFDKVRGKQKAIRTLANKYRQLSVDQKNHIVGISHSDCSKDANYLAELIDEIASPKDIIIVNHEPVTGSHLGPDSLALYFVGQEGVRKR